MWWRISMYVEYIRASVACVRMAQFTPNKVHCASERNASLVREEWNGIRLFVRRGHRDWAACA